MHPVRYTSLQLKVLMIFLVVALLAGLPLGAQGSVSSEDLLEFGDGVDPVAPGAADILGSEQAGPDWGDLFAADRSPLDQLDEFGSPGANGVPDFLDSYGAFKYRRDGAFLADDISAGVGVDSTVPTGPGQVGPGTVTSDQDVGNAYAYLAFSDSRDLVLYLGAERLGTGAGYLLFELNQRLFSIDGTGQLAGERKVGDLRVQADFSAGILSQVDLQSWELLDEVLEIHGWLSLETLPLSPELSAEQCNGAGTVCAVCNGVSVDGGAWPNYDVSGAATADLVPDTFIEIGVNLTALFGYHTYSNYYDTRYASLQVSTEADYSLAAFERASRLARFRNPPPSP